MLIRALLPTDDRSHFRSGNIELDRFFQRFAGQNQFRVQLGVTHVAVAEGRILGFIELVADEGGMADHLQTTLMFLGVRRIRAALPPH